jgi:hypothetical protein
MQRCALFVALVGLCIFSISDSAQNPSVQLCIAGMQVAGGAGSDVGSRDVLIKTLNKEKPNKALPIENVPVNPSVPEDALAAAKQKGCDFVVTTNQTETHVEKSWTADRMSGGANMQTFYVTTTYKLTKVSGGSELSSGSFKGDGDSPQAALGNAMKKIADKVTETIRKAGPIVK